MSKKYELKLMNVGEDTYILMSKGHHSVEEFMAAVKENYPSWFKFLDTPEHSYCKATPTRLDGYKCMYPIVDKSVKGSFPVTISSETYLENSYQFLTKNRDNK